MPEIKQAMPEFRPTVSEGGYKMANVFNVSKEIKDLNLLLLYLNRWGKNKEEFVSLKAFPYETCQELQEKGLIMNKLNTKTILITEEGIKKAKEVKNIFFNYEGENKNMTESDLLILLMFLSGWQENDRFTNKVIFRSWKGYLFDVLSELNESQDIRQFRSLKTVLITKKGVEKAKALKTKYIG